MLRTCIVIALLSPIQAMASGPHTLSFDLLARVPNLPLAGAPADGRRTVVSRQAAADMIAAMQAGGGSPVDHAKIEIAGNERSVPFRKTAIRSYLGAGERPGEVTPKTLQVGLVVTGHVGPKADEVSYEWSHIRLTGPVRGFREVERAGVRYQEPEIEERTGKGADKVPLDGVIVQRSGDEVAFIAWD